MKERAELDAEMPSRENVHRLFREQVGRTSFARRAGLSSLSFRWYGRLIG